MPRDVDSISQHFVALELRFEPIGRALFNLKRVTISKIVAETVDHFPKDAIRFPFIHFEGTNLINQIVDHIAKMHGVQHSQSEIDGKFQAWLAGRRFDPIAVFE